MSLLDLKERFFGQRRRLANLTVLLLSNAFTAGVGLLATIIIANSLGSERFGELAFAMAVGGILAVNVRFGMDRSLIRDFVRCPEKVAEILFVSLVARGTLLGACILGLTILITTKFEYLEISWEMVPAIFAAMLAPLQIANVFDFWEIQGRHALFQCVERGAYFFLILLLAFCLPDSLSVLSVGLASLTAIILSLFLQYRYVWTRLESSFRRIVVKSVPIEVIAVLSNNKWLWLAAVAGLGLGAFNRVVLGNVAGAAQLGVFAAAFQVVTIGVIYLKSIARIGRPILARRVSRYGGRLRGESRFLMSYIVIVVIGTVPIAGPMFVYSELILSSVFIPEYAEGHLILSSLGLYLVVHAVLVVLAQYLTLARLDKAYFSAIVISGLAGAISCLLLVPEYAGLGVTGSLIIGEAAGIVVSLVVCVGHFAAFSKPSK